MKWTTTTIILLLTTICAWAQIDFEKGYFIENSGQRVDCLIKNVDWKNNPNQFTYKLTEDSEERIGDIGSIREFGVHDFSKYVRAEVEIDRSKDHIDDLTHGRSPKFEPDILFLQVLIDGAASLLYYEESNLRRYFYQSNGAELNQLVYRRYLVNTSGIKENNQFRQQLTNNLHCTDGSSINTSHLDYKQRDLIRYFKKYNECVQSDYEDYGSASITNNFHLSVIAGLHLGHLSIRNEFPSIRDQDFGSQLGYRLGLSLESVLPFNNGKWDFVSEVLFQSYNVENSMVLDGSPGNSYISDVDYRSIELPLGIRHNFFTGGNSRIFLNAFYVFDITINSSIEFRVDDNTPTSILDVRSRNNFAIGAGYKHKNTWHVEVRYQSPRHILSDYFYWNSSYQTLSILVGYTLF